MRQVDRFYGQPEIAELEATLSRAVEELRTRIADPATPRTPGSDTADTR